MTVLREMGAIQAARQLRWHGEGEISLPAAVVEVIIVKMDGTIMSRVVHPIVLAAVPGVSLHGPGREIDGGAMPAVWRNIHYVRGRDTATEIPVPDDGVIQDRWRGLLQESHALRCSEAAAGDHWLFELAVAKASSDHTTRLRPSTSLDVPGSHTESCARCWMHSELRLAFRCGVVACVAHERSLSHPRLTRGNVKTCGDQIPVACEQWHLRADELAAPAISHEQGKGTRVVEDERIAPTARLLPGAEQGLA